MHTSPSRKQYAHVVAPTGGNLQVIILSSFRNVIPSYPDVVQKPKLNALSDALAVISADAVGTYDSLPAL